MNAFEKDEKMTLEILQAVEEEAGVTQRYIAKRLGIALGLANSYLKRCARKGLIKIHQAPANRYLYYLTPRGFSEKSRLTAQYLSFSFGFYRQALASCDRLFDACQGRGITSVMVCGGSDLADITLLSALGKGMVVVGLFDPQERRDKFFGRPLWHTLPTSEDAETFVITDLEAPLDLWQRLAADVGADRLLVPDILGPALGGIVPRES